ncbi:MAG: penicillin-binding protein [Oscillospiraceae bacterium]|nr:penicillin-binding protein [Oscillospiraceae bacterium]
MKKITNRALSVLLIAALVIFGMGAYIINYIDHGKEWALYFSRSNSDSTGHLVDRNGIVLAYFSGEENLFSPDEFTREANYHVTGDYWDRTGTGILSRYWSDSQGFSLLTGTTRAEDSILSLSIDARLNNKIYECLGRENDGAMLVCNYRTGELLGMVSSPSLDPLNPGEELRDGTYINRCISASFIPGSIFKLITAAAAIENMPDLSTRKFFCEGEYKIAGVPVTCIAGHWNQSFEEALSNSCNIAFAQIAVDLGQQTMIKYVQEYGMLDSHKLSGISTAKGSYPLNFVGDPELGWSGIGQSTDLVCPYSMLRLVCAIANGGTVIEPYMIQGEESNEVQLVKASTAAKLAEMMNYTAIDHYGAEEMFPGLNIAAKTGTAELGDGTAHSWFVGFLQDEEHPYAFVTLVERGGFGITAAGSVTGEVLQWAVENLE